MRHQTKVFKLNYESSARGVQKYMQITTTGTKFDLDMKEGTNAAVTASYDATYELGFLSEETINCP